MLKNRGEKMKIFYVMLVVLLFAVSACVQQTVETQPKPQEPAEANVPSETTVTEEAPEIQKVPEDAKEAKEISPEVKELLSKADTRIQSLQYSYNGPETGDFLYNFYVKGGNIKYIPSYTNKVYKAGEDPWDTIYINKEVKTAETYCDDRTCQIKGKISDLDYDEYYIQTPLDWLSQIESAEKVSEEQIEKRSTWKISTNKGTMWIDTYYGIPMKIDSDGTVYEFQKMSFNTLKDEDVVPR
jgi:hypothetical protein